MEPAFPDGSYCLFSSPVTGSRQGKTVLAQLHEGSDPETGNRYTIKRHESEMELVCESRRHFMIILKPVSPEFQPIVLPGIEEDALRIIADLCKQSADVRNAGAVVLVLSTIKSLQRPVR
jgi:hypothetical protein